jgi:hypothetical protein
MLKTELQGLAGIVWENLLWFHMSSIDQELIPAG